MSQLVESAHTGGTNSRREKSARDYSAHFHQLVIAHFDMVGSIRKTARHHRVTPSVVNEILHLRNLRRPVESQRGASMLRTAGGMA